VKQKPALIEVKGLKKSFAQTSNSQNQLVHAVRDISLEIYQGETLGLVGESGCGKSTLGRLILRLINTDAGQIWFSGNNITHLNSKGLHPIRQEMQIVFQDPYSSLNPRMRVCQLLMEPLLIHKLFSSKIDKLNIVNQLIEMVGLKREDLDKFPHEFSGGQRQRIGIARALACNPKFLVCDEPVSALDVSIQAQVINLLMDLQDKLSLTLLFIAHDLRVVEHISTRIAVMYLGKIIEIGDRHEICQSPSHPYTKALISAIPSINPYKKTNRVILKGDPPSPISLPTGCSFYGRCPEALPKCGQTSPELKSISSNRQVACLLRS